MKFRDLDFWQGLADDFNQMVDRLERPKRRSAAAEATPTDRDGRRDDDRRRTGATRSSDGCLATPSTTLQRTLPCDRRHSHSMRRANVRRRGVAASELAVCLPVIVLLVLAMIEACTMIFLKQSLTVAAYEGVRTAIEPNGDRRRSADGVRRRAPRSPRAGATSRSSPPNLAVVARGEYIDSDRLGAGRPQLGHPRQLSSRSHADRRRPR